MKTEYPTKEEILETEVKFKEETLGIVHEWKGQYYTNGKWKITDKNAALTELLKRISLFYKKPVEITIADYEPSYSPDEHTIYLNAERPSIVSSLHELAHHLKGNSELTACRWSVWLFKKTFPEAYEKLVWEGHMLRKK
jgi:hypothetical protein